LKGDKPPGLGRRRLDRKRNRDVFVRRRRGRSPPKGGGQIEPTVARTRAATVAGSARR